MQVSTVQTLNNLIRRLNTGDIDSKEVVGIVNHVKDQKPFDDSLATMAAEFVRSELFAAKHPERQ